MFAKNEGKKVFLSGFFLVRMTTMKASTQDEAKGKFHEVKGKVKEVAGKLSDNPESEAEGTNEKIGGRFRKRSARSKRFWVIEHRDAIGLSIFFNKLNKRRKK
jgi:uncharacterized protein YjbJ (UPF0337 family)